MGLNNRGQIGSLYLAIIFGAMVFFAGMILLNFITPVITDTRIALDCTNIATITDGTKLSCLLTDSVMPYIILLILSIAGGYIFSRIAP